MVNKAELFGAEDGKRLKQVNLELSQLASQHKACRVNSGLFSGLAAVVLTLSLVGLIHLLPAGASDWTQNPNSPVYALASQEQGALTFKAVVVAIGFIAGLVFFYFARQQCSQQRSLWQREGDLRGEMRQIRDRLYIVDQLKQAHHADTDRPVGHTEPLAPDEARGEYVGVYNPPESDRPANPERA